MNRFTLIFLFTILNSYAQSFFTGLKPDTFELSHAVKEANPRYVKHRGLPSEVDLSPHMPPVGNQGMQGSCVAWSTGYANKSYHEFIERRDSQSWKYTSNNSPNPKVLFSPAYIYNQINGGRDNGSSIYDAMSLLVSKGALTLDQMPYDINNFTRQPTPDQFQMASKYKAKEFQKVRYNDPSEIKSQLAQNRPVVVGILVDQGFNELRGKTIYKEQRGQSFGGHAITIVGYSDTTNSFKFQNSWGTEWGDNGFGYIDYRFLARVCKSAYVLIDQIDPNVEITKINPNADNTPEIKMITDTSISPPAEIHATKGNFSDKIVLSWTSVPKAIGYEIYRAYPEEDEYELVGLSSRTYFEDTGVFSDTAYNYKLTAVSEYAVSAKSEGEVVGFSTATKVSVPVKVSGLTASVGLYFDRILLDWQSQENTTGYIIYKYDPSSRIYRVTGRTMVSHFEDINAKRDGGTEIYTVVAYNQAGDGEPSHSAIGRTSVGIKPSAPQNLNATMGNYRDKVELKWIKAYGAKEYLVYRFDQSAWTPIGTTSKEFFSDTNVSKGKKYYTVISKSKDNIFGSYSNYAMGYVDPNLSRGNSKLSAPLNLEAKLDNTGTQVSLKWDAVDGAEEYNVWYRVPGAFKWNFIDRVSAPNISFLSTLPQKNMFYLFSVTSKTLMGRESEYSSPVSMVSSVPRKAVARRSFLGANKLDQIAGTWSALQWDGATGVKNIVMEIESTDSTHVTIKIDNKKTYSARYINQSPEIDFEGKIKIKISSDDALMVELKDSSISKERAELSFLRD
jgi:C1A family cysteine protease/fibronectin type 3 domain-containing protein